MTEVENSITLEPCETTMIQSDGGKLDYIIGTKGKEQDIKSKGVVYISGDKVDYEVPVPDNLKHKHKESLPLSYLQIKSLDEGESWYEKRFPELPDELYPLMARYSFGDLSYLTKKEMEKIARKSRKKQMKQEHDKVHFKQGDVTVVFE